MTMRRLTRKTLAVARDETGLTMIEVMVATIVLVMGAMATFGILVTATKNAQRAKASQTVLHLAQEEMERMRSLSYSQLAITEVPTVSSNPKNPNSRIVGSTFALQKSTLAEPEPLVVDPEGISPESPFNVGSPEGGGVSGTVYRYVVWRNDDGCPETQCPGDDYKQLIVAVKPSTPGNQTGERGYVEVQSEFVDPDELPEPPTPDPDPDDEGEPEPDPGSDVTAQQFFLSDTPCAKTGTTVRAQILADHLLHNTLGRCADGAQTGSTPGAPDALLLGAPPDPAPEDEFNPLLYDYADDFYLEPTPDTDKGLQIRRDDTIGCNYEPTGSANPESQVHRWVTDPMSVDFVMSDKVSLEFSTRTLNDALHTGTLCIFLFKRSEPVGATEPDDDLLTNSETGEDFWEFTPDSNAYWPRFGWAKERLTMFFDGAPYTIPKDQRLGVALSVERVNTPADAIPIMYDHPNHPTRLEVDTDNPIEAGE
jgi:type II secretory pathway pseudopilin PulG